MENLRMKIRDWLLLLPPEISKVARENVKNSPQYADQDEKYPSLQRALENAFWWAGSDQGVWFWNDINTEIMKMEEGKPYDLDKFEKLL
jgi:hypothetical protein